MESTQPNNAMPHQRSVPPPSPGRVWGSVGMTVLGYNLLLGSLIALPSFLIPTLGGRLDERGVTTVALTGTLVAELIALYVLVRWLRRDGRRLADIGWRRSTTVTAIVAGVVFGGAYAAYTLGIPAVGDNATEISLFKVLGVVVGVSGGVIEEIVFRGFVITELDRIGTPVPVQILVSGLTFAMIHAGFNISGIIVTFVMGLILATLFVVGKRSLTPVAISHGLINAVIEPWLLLFIITYYAEMFAS